MEIDESLVIADDCNASATSSERDTCWRFEGETIGTGEIESRFCIVGTTAPSCSEDGSLVTDVESDCVVVITEVVCFVRERSQSRMNPITRREQKTTTKIPNNMIFLVFFLSTIFCFHTLTPCNS